jgi:hypothetical protein
VRSFKASLFIGALFLVCLFVCFVYVCARWLMRLEWTSFEKFWRAWSWRTLSNNTTPWLKASVSLFFSPSNFINHYCICLALIWWVPTKDDYYSFYRCLV